MIYKYRLNSQITVTIDLLYNINYSMPDRMYYLYSSLSLIL